MNGVNTFLQMFHLQAIVGTSVSRWLPKWVKNYIIFLFLTQNLLFSKPDPVSVHLPHHRRSMQRYSSESYSLVSQVSSLGNLQDSHLMDSSLKCLETSPPGYTIGCSGMANPDAPTEKSVTSYVIDRRYQKGLGLYLPTSYNSATCQTVSCC